MPLCVSFTNRQTAHICFCTFSIIIRIIDRQALFRFNDDPAAVLPFPPALSQWNGRNIKISGPGTVKPFTDSLPEIQIFFLNLIKNILSYVL